MTPLVEDFIAKCLAFGILKTLYVFKVGWVLSDQSATLEYVGDVGQLVLSCELIDVTKELALRNTGKRVLDSGDQSEFLFRLQ